ncbi:MAG: DUF6391 domain-containing protein [Anaerolineae bacterium]
MNLLDLPPIGTLRRNHALEHATMHLLTQRHPGLRLVAHATLSGFTLYGEVDTQEVSSAVTEAISRLQGGEHHLAVHPRCGTNIATAGLLAGLATFIVMRGKGRLRKLPRALLASVAALVVAQPLGLGIQARLTTLPDLEGAFIEEVTRQQMANLIVHRVKVSGYA